MDILTIGEALIDFKQTRKLSFDGFEGGSPLNVSIAASRLGAKVGFAGQVSTDLFGQALRNYLIDNQVDDSFLLEHNAPSTLAFVAEIDGDAHFSFLNNGAADTLYNPQPRPTLPKELQYLMFGSISLLNEPTASSIEEIVERQKNKSNIVFDPNIRPALIKDKKWYLKRFKKWLSLADIVKVSSQDLEWLLPNMAFESIALDWLEQNPIAVIVTDGEKAATLYRKKQKPLHSKTFKVEVVDTVGAGDTFSGALMVSLLDKDLSGLDDANWQKALDFAATAAALNCTRAGANPPTEQELYNFINHI